jgi:hypothetical protein
VSPVKYELGFYVPEDDILQVCLVVKFVGRLYANYRASVQDDVQSRVNVGMRLNRL